MNLTLCNICDNDVITAVMQEPNGQPNLALKVKECSMKRMTYHREAKGQLEEKGGR